MTKKRSKKFKGVTFLKNKNLWFARITFSGVRYSLGKFKSYEKATEIYRQALEAGGVAVKAWCNTPIEYRGSFGDKVMGESRFPTEENAIKNFVNIKQDEEDLFKW